MQGHDDKASHGEARSVSQGKDHSSEVQADPRLSQELGHRITEWLG